MKQIVMTFGLSLALTLSSQVNAQSDPAVSTPEAAPVANSSERPATTVRAQPVRRVGVTLNLDQVPLRQALKRWAAQSGRQIVAVWRAIELDGIDPDTPITLKAVSLPPGRALRLILNQASASSIDGVAGGDAQLLYEVTPWYIEIMTKGMANRRPTTKIYYIGDLLHEVPHFTDAPTFSLTDALSNTNSGGGGAGNAGGGGGDGIFNDASVDGNEKIGTSRQARGEQLADVIRNTLEPSLWKANGGDVASITYRQNYLIVRAPFYVHQQIGIPERSTKRTRTPAAATTRQGVRSTPVSGIRGQ